MDLLKIAARIAVEVSPELAPFEHRHRDAIQKIYEGLEEYYSVYQEIAKLPQVTGSSKAKNYVHSTMNHVVELQSQIKDWGDDFPVLQREMSEQDPPEPEDHDE